MCCQLHAMSILSVVKDVRLGGPFCQCGGEKKNLPIGNHTLVIMSIDSNFTAP